MARVMVRDELSECCFMGCDHDGGGIVLAKIFRCPAVRMWMNKENIPLPVIILFHSSDLFNFCLLDLSNNEIN